MHHRRLAALAIVPLLALGACNGDSDAEPPEPTAGATTTPPTPDPDPSPTGPVEPPVPDAMAKPTKAGAKAFVTYYWDVFNYAQATGDVRVLRSLALQGCDVCEDFSGAIRDLYRGQGSVEGGNRELLRFDTLRVLTASVGKVFEARFVISIDQHQVSNGADGKVREFDAATTGYSFQMLKSDRGWKVTYAERYR